MCLAISIYYTLIYFIYCIKHLPILFEKVSQKSYLHILCTPEFLSLLDGSKIADLLYPTLFRVELFPNSLYNFLIIIHTPQLLNSISSIRLYHKTFNYSIKFKFNSSNFENLFLINYILNLIE